MPSLRNLFLTVLFLIGGYGLSQSQPFRFALVTDTHVGGSTGLEDLERTVLDLNQSENIDFAIFSGDITEFGSDDELAAAHAVLSGLRLPWHVIPGNHDSNWSESGGNSFLTVFGGDTFAFEHKGVLFMGTASGPNMRMAPGQIPRENLVWMDEVLSRHTAERKPIVFVNHYPLDESLNNWFEAIDRLKGHNIQLALCGHGHQNRLFDFEGIPGVMCRSNLRAADSVGAYQIITYDGVNAAFHLRYPGVRTEENPWLEVPLIDHHFPQAAEAYVRPDYSVNEQDAGKRQVLWQYQDDSDLGVGFAVADDLVITANTAGYVYALDNRTGEVVWTFPTKGKVYSTPSVWQNFVIFGSSDHHIYCLNAENGLLQWEYTTGKAVLASAITQGGVGYIGSSDGVFRAFDLESGRLIWSFEGIKDYVSGKPLIYGNRIYFGSWGNDFYALDMATGRKEWEWSNGSANRMLSPAACYPVGSNGRIFIVAPDRYMTALDAQTGQVVWRENKEKDLGIRVRESMGLSEDGKLVYVKTMDGELLGISTTADHMEVVWKSKLQLPYELTPSAITVADGLVFVPSHSGLVSAVNAADGEVVWQYKISNAMVNPMTILSGRRLAAGSMDGEIALIHYE